MSTVTERSASTSMLLPDELERAIAERIDAMSPRELKAWTKKRKQYDQEAIAEASVCDREVR